MFGYIEPHLPELKVKEAELYRSIYCGLCRTMGGCTGHLSRLTLSYDMTFLVLIRLAITGERGSFETFRCVVHPLRRRVAMRPCDALRFSATASGLLVYRKWQDNLRDERGIRRFFFRLLSPFFARIHKKTMGMDAVAAAADAALSELHALEVAGSTSADACADRFGELLAAVVADGLGGADARIARDIGFHTGRFIYLLDAADDVEDDKKRGAYNPFLAGETEVKKSTALQTALRLELIALEKSISLLDIADAGIAALIENILYLGMPRRLDEVLGFLPPRKRRRGLPDVRHNEALTTDKKERTDV